MFLEQCGQFFFSRMRPSFFFAFCLFPLFMAAILLFMEHGQLQDLEMRFANAAHKEKLSVARRGRKDRFLQRYGHADPYFLDQKIESFALLQKEAKKLESLLNHPAFPESLSLKERLAFLKENRFSFAEENIRVSTQIKEVEEKQRHPVQMDESDLKNILSLIEDVPIESSLPSKNSPQIVIKDFRLKKQETSLQTPVFEVEMDLIKREFTKS